MKKIIRLTESDLTKLVRRVIKEQESNNLVEKYMSYMDYFVGHYRLGITVNEIQYLVDGIETVYLDANEDNDLSDDELNELYEYADGLIKYINDEFYH
jgi:hypothetical protein